MKPNNQKSFTGLWQWRLIHDPALQNPKASINQCRSYSFYCGAPDIDHFIPDIVRWNDSWITIWREEDDPDDDVLAHYLKEEAEELKEEDQ